MKILSFIPLLFIPFVLAAAEPEKFIYKTVGDEEIELYVTRSELTETPITGSSLVLWEWA